MLTALNFTSAVAPTKLSVISQSASKKAGFHVVAGTGKGFGAHRVSHPKKDSSNHLLNYEKLVPGYADMSRPQKYRARKHIKEIMNKRHNDRAQAMAVKNSSQVAKKVYAQFQACVDACEGPECVQECEAEWNM